MSLIPKRNTYVFKIIFKLLIFFLNFTLALNKISTKILYIKTNGIINEMKIIDESNNIKSSFTGTDLDIYGDNIFKKEIEAQYGEQINIKILKNDYNIEISIGILLQVKDIFYELNDSDFIVLFNGNKICNEIIGININNTYIKNISYCNLADIDEAEVKIVIPFNIYEIDCYETCSECYATGNDTNHNCLICNNTKGYYFKENSDNNNCYNKDTIEIGYYLDSNNKVFKQCNLRCLTCEGGGDNLNSNCTKCNNNYHFDPIEINHCVKFNELPNSSFYLDNIDDKYKLCHESCLKCSDKNYDNCISCHNQQGYYPKEIDTNLICYSNLTIEEGYYLDESTKEFKKCDIRCKTCNKGDTICQKCNNDYHFHPSIENHCITIDELLAPNYYLNINEDKYEICHESCSTCNGPNNNNCTSCNGETLFEVEYFDNKCLKQEEIPENYYNISNSGIVLYYRCHISCKTCLIGGINNCQECNIEDGYYPMEDKFGSCLKESEIPHKYYLDKENKIIYKCYQNCDSCLKGFNHDSNEMNCEICIPGTYFQNISSTNCISKPETRYYIDLYNGKETLFPCHKNCLTCNKGGNDINNECLSCYGDFYFDDEITTNCIDDDIECAIGCAKCYKNKTDTNYGIVSADKMCKRCSSKMGYYPLEKYSIDQFYVSCYPYNNSPKNYIFDEIEKIHKLCYKTCEKCFQVGDNLNHSCISCDTNYMFIDEEPSNCFPKCDFNYYYTKYNQYRCTESNECPLEYPYLILNKTKCVDNCYLDDKFNLMFKNECFQKCPEGTNAYLYKYNGEYTAKCVDSNEILDESECKLNVKGDNQLEYDKITEEILQQYAEEYVHDYPVVNTYVTTYSSSIGSLSKYLIVLYKLEKCPKQKVEGYISIDLDECIDKVKTENTIIQNIVVEILYVIRKSAPPQINYYLYHPDTGEKLDLSVCSGAKLAIKTSIFDNGEVEEELVKYFTNLNINLFDINDPFFTDICFNFSKDGKDVPLDDRIKLYYQNVSLCEDGCTYVGINLETFEVECSCDVHNTETNKNIDIAKSLLDNPISNEVFGFITNSNLEVLKCIKKAFNSNLIITNFGGLLMIVIYFVQIITSIFIKIQNKKVRHHIYSLINEFDFPPKRKVNKVKFQNLNNFGNNTNDTGNKTSKDVIIYNSSSNIINEKNSKYNKKNNQIKINLENSINDKNIISKSNINNIRYQLIKQSSLNSITTYGGKKGKYSYVKKGSIPNSTNYTNLTPKKGKNNNNSYENNNAFININNSNGSGNGSSFGGFRINSGGSEFTLKNLEENGENGNIKQNEIRYKKPFFNERKGVGTFINYEYIKNNSCSFSDEQENIYKDINENKKKFGNDNNKKENNNIPINEIIFDKENKNISNFKLEDNENIISNNDELNISKIDKERQINILDIDSKNKLEKKDKIRKLKRKFRKEIMSEIKQRLKEKEQKELKKKEIFVSYEHKDYNEKEINELDYEEAIIYDKRTFSQIFWYTLKQKQTIINTFCSKDPLKPFSIKLSVMIFSFTCYFVINGFLYNEEYVSNKLTSEGNKGFYEYISDSIERILYTSIVGGLISFIIGILFNTEKKIEKVIDKNKNNKILLKGEIAKIYRCNNIRIIGFIILQFIIMGMFTIYIFCFCYVYPNNKLDWFESSLIIITIMQSFSLFSSILISFIKYLSLKFQCELCFKINAYLDDNL